jgi:hypothetical protein
MSKCQCSFSIRMLGDGCRYCQPQEYIDRLHESMEDMVHIEEIDKDEALSIYQSWMLTSNDPLLLIKSIEQHLKGE